MPFNSYTQLLGSRITYDNSCAAILNTSGFGEAKSFLQHLTRRSQSHKKMKRKKKLNQNVRTIRDLGDLSNALSLSLSDLCS